MLLNAWLDNAWYDCWAKDTSCGVEQTNCHVGILSLDWSLKEANKSNSMPIEVAK